MPIEAQLALSLAFMEVLGYYPLTTPSWIRAKVSGLYVV